MIYVVRSQRELLLLLLLLEKHTRYIVLAGNPRSEVLHDIHM